MTTTAPTIDFAAVAASATVAATSELPSTSTPRPRLDLTPLVELIKKAKKDGNRYDLTQRFSLEPYAGRKNACEAQTMVTHLHAAARLAGVKLAVRRVDATAKDTALTFKVIDK
jgi:hypothetical protein